MPASTIALRILVYSSNVQTRERVMRALGKQLHPDLPELSYVEVATGPMVIQQMDAGGIDLAILDVNVNGKVISPVADVIKAQNRPFIFATGYGSSGLPEEYRDRPALQKPFQLETLGRMIDTALRGTAA